jgi:hypothetical protein
VEIYPELGCLTCPYRVDGTALAGPVLEVLGVEFEFGEEGAEVAEGFGLEGG